jgi:hypothetical protein
MNIEELVSVPIGEVAVIRRFGPDDAHGEVLVKEERGSPGVGRLTRHHLRCLKVTATKRIVRAAIDLHSRLPKRRHACAVMMKVRRSTMVKDRKRSIEADPGEALLVTQRTVRTPEDCVRFGGKFTLLTVVEHQAPSR